MSAIKNLIFDLGGVIIDLSVDHTLQAFSDLSGMGKEKVIEIFHTSNGFLDFEKGLMTDEEFRDFIRETYSIKNKDADIDYCWNAMLRGIPLTKLKLLTDLKQQYNVFLLSNTNGIHLDYINGQMMPAIAPGNLLDDYFHCSYYSHRMKKRKPEAAIFQEVLDENGLKAEETLFLDDNAGNVEGARQLGIQTVHVVSPDMILDYFHG